MSRFEMGPYTHEETPVQPRVKEVSLPPTDLGWDIKRYSDVYNAIHELGSMGDTRVVDAAAILTAKTRQQLPFALDREERKAKELKINRRLALGLCTTTAVLGLTSLAVQGGVPRMALETANTIYTSAQSAKEKREKEEQERKRTEQLAWENSHTLGLSPTAKSSEGWIAYYKEFDPQVNFEPKDTQNDVFPLKNPFPVELNRTIRFTSSETVRKSGQFTTVERLARDTRLQLSHYTRLDGQVVPKLTVLGENNKSQEVILRSGVTDPRIDTRVLVIEHIEDRAPLYLQLNKSQSAVEYSVTIMRKTPVNPR